MKWKIAAFAYRDGKAPDGYRCTGCGTHGCKLWRQYQAFASNIQLLCGACALADQEEAGPIDAKGFRFSKTINQPTDQIGWLVPAVPTEDGRTYWGLSSVPEDGVRWWRALPTQEEHP